MAMAIATDKVEECPRIELNGRYIEVTKKFCYLGDTILNFRMDKEWVKPV